ncbi:hypothetical protein QOZ80_5BG0412790 [Eleusine coracana subsp. coracana]|nr:hypothetical protein QOZ80_5BG0412790 [Eleusine coracana subsp. coracana]
MQQQQQPFQRKMVVSKKLMKGRPGRSRRAHGGAGGNHTTQIKLSFPEEHLTAVSGHYHPIAPDSSPVIRSLAFGTNQREYGPFGIAEGTPFTFPVDGGVIAGFWGRSGWQLDAVGLYVAPLRPETMSHRVHQLGLAAYRRYRTVMHWLGPQQQQQQQKQHEHEQVKQQNGNVQTTRKAVCEKCSANI